MLTFQPDFYESNHRKAFQNVLEENQSLLATVQAVEEQYQDNLGWLDVEQHASANHLSILNELAQEIRSQADVFILIGVGGSNNAARGVIEALQKWDDSIEIIYSGNTLSAHQLNKVLHRIRGKSVYLNCIAKNFETLEPGASFRVLRNYLEETYGKDKASRRIICTGTKGSFFESFSQKAGYRFLDFPLEIGGRFTALTNVGLLPMAVAGIDIVSLVSGAKAMQKQLNSTGFSENIAYQYACYRQLWARKDFRIEMLATFEPRFHYFAKWWLQLFAESEGKEGRGLYPTYAEYSEDLHAVGQYVQDGMLQIFETFLVVEKPTDTLVFPLTTQSDCFEYLEGKDFEEINQSAYVATFEAHAKRIPCSILTIDYFDATHFGALFYFFQYACYLACRMINVNPFNQPGVEAYKNLMFQALKKNE